MSGWTEQMRTAIEHGGFTLGLLVLASVLAIMLVVERAWTYRVLSRDMDQFQREALAHALRGERDALIQLVRLSPQLPSARLAQTALDRQSASDPRLRGTWRKTVERTRALENEGLRSRLWLLGSIGAAAPFVGLFGTVVGILRSFQEIGRTGTGGFAVVAAGIAEALVATAAGILVAVIAIMAYNALQTRCASLVLRLKIHADELCDLLAGGGDAGSA